MSAPVKGAVVEAQASSAPSNAVEDRPLLSISSRSQFSLALTLAAVSGTAGLAHQLLWIRRMVDVLGVNSDTFSKVISAFFLGLASGAYIAERWPAKRLSRGVAYSELATAFLAGLVLLLGNYALQWQGILPDRLLKWVLPLALIVPPAATMGMVIPWLARAAGESRAVWLYAVNTIGGVLGVFLTLLFLLPTLGLAGASLCAIALNCFVALGALLLSSEQRASMGESIRKRSCPKALMFSFSSGFLVLGSEVILQHQLSQVTINSHFSSGGVLCLVLIALALAAAFVPFVSRLQSWALPFALTLAVVGCALEPLLLIVQRGGLHYLAYDLAPLVYAGELLKLGMLSVFPMIIAAGLVFPLLLHSPAASHRTGLGLLLAANGVGGWLGAELTNRWVGPHFGLWWSMSIFAGGYGICAIVAAPRRRLWLGLLLIAVVGWSAKVNGHLPHVSLAKGEKLLAVGVSREAVVAAVETTPDDRRILFNNTYTLGGSRAQVNQERQALLPILLHGEARTVATLGVATGSTVAGATLDSQVAKIEAVELSALAVVFARQFFTPFNRGALDNPRVCTTLEDARWVMARRPAIFDVIVGDLFLPWRTGEGRLFTQEHFTNVRASLRPGGLYCQWLPMFQLTRPQFECILRTFRSVFPEVFLVRGDFYTEMPILGLVGGRDISAIEWARVAAACERIRGADECHDPLVRHPEGIAMCVIGPAAEPPPGPLNTLSNGWLEWDAGKNVIGLRQPWFVGISCATYVRDIQRASRELLPEDLRQAHEAGQFFLTLEIAKGGNLSNTAQLETNVSGYLPQPLRNDPGVSWHEWPMRYRPNLP